MRLYPPVWVYVRDSIGADQLGGYHVPGKSMIMLSQYITHRHPEFWRDPGAVRPREFRSGAEREAATLRVLPLRRRPANLPGQQLRAARGALAVARVTQRYRLRLLPGQDIRPKMVGTLRPSAPVMMRLEAR